MNGELVLMRGMILVPVGNLQEQLYFLGFSPGSVDNIFGIQTEVAVRQFQESAGLPITGVVDAETWRMLFEGEPLSGEGLIPGESDERLFEDRAAASQIGPAIEVNLARRELTHLRNGTVVKVYPVAIGKPSTPTPIGNWTILNKQLNPGGVFGTRWMGFTTRGHGIHGTNQPSSIGNAVSNGCVRMYNHDVEELFDQVQVGTPVRVRSGVEDDALPPGRYVVQPGDTLFLIASRFGTTVEELRRLNNLTSDIIVAGQVLRVEESAQPAPGVISYTVKAGDTLYFLAREYGTTVERIRELNNLQTNTIFVGQILYIPVEEGGGAELYVVQPGDTLYQIAVRYGTSVSALVDANNLTSTLIYPGQRLVIPQR